MWNNKTWELGNSATTEGKYVSKLMTSQPERFLSCLHNYVNAHMWHCMIQRITMVLVIYLLHWFEFRARDWVCTWAHDYHPLEFHSLGLSKATWVITFGFVYHYTNLLAIYGYNYVMASFEYLRLVYTIITNHLFQWWVKFYYSTCY